ncbi:SCO6880 family protein [Microbacterium sp. CCNWLW44]
MHLAGDQPADGLREGPESAVTELPEPSCTTTPLPLMGVVCGPGRCSPETAAVDLVILRSAYDPAIAATLERHGQLGQSLATAGPGAVNETWTRLRTDCAHHGVLWVSEWPRSLVYPGFLSPVLLSTGIQRSFSLLCTPMRSDQAARDIRMRKVEHISDQAQRAKFGQIEDATQTAEYHDVFQQEADLTAGHGVLRYTGLIAVSAATIEELDAGVAAIEQAAIQASCESRLLVGQQAAAFTAAALPLCRRV